MVNVNKLVRYFAEITDAGLRLEDSIVKYYEARGIEIYPKEKALKEFPELAKYFEKAPEHSFLVRIHGKNRSFQACFAMKSIKKQMPLTVYLIEPNTTALITKGCYAIAALKGATHAGKSIILLGKGATLSRVSFHSWAGREKVISSTTVIADKGAAYNSLELLINPARENFYFTAVKPKEGATDLKIAVDDFYFLNNAFLRTVSKIKLPRSSKGLLRTRAVLRNSKSEILSYLEGSANTAGTVECGGLLLDDASVFFSTPAIKALAPTAALSHEAYTSVISEEALFYLRSKGFTEAKAKELVVKGFLTPTVEWLPKELRTEVERIASLAAL